MVVGLMSYFLNCDCKFFSTATQFLVSKEHFHFSTSQSSSLSFLVIDTYVYRKPTHGFGSAHCSFQLVFIDQFFESDTICFTVSRLSFHLAFVNLFVGLQFFYIMPVLPEKSLSHLTSSVL